MTRTRRRAAATLAGALIAAGLIPALPAGAAVNAALGYDPSADKGALSHIATTVGATDSFRAGFTGKGVGIALIDTGVTEVRGLDTGNVWHGPGPVLRQPGPRADPARTATGTARTWRRSSSAATRPARPPRTGHRPASPASPRTRR